MPKIIDLTGQSFGRLTVISKGQWIKRSLHWLCQCSCGTLKSIRGYALRSGTTGSCGCLGRDVHSKNFVGLKSGLLTAIERISDGHGNTKYRCLCECGNQKVISGCNLRLGHTKSCGCRRWDNFRATRRLRASARAGESSFNRSIAAYRQRADKAGLSFSLTVEEFRSMTSLRCHYCDAPPSNVSRSYHGNGDYTYNGLDRVNNSIGYIKDNVVPCCEVCNKAKRNMTQEDFLDWASRVYNHRILLEISTSVNWNIA